MTDQKLEYRTKAWLSYTLGIAQHRIEFVSAVDQDDEERLPRFVEIVPAHKASLKVLYNQAADLGLFGRTDLRRGSLTLYSEDVAAAAGFVEEMFI